MEYRCPCCRNFLSARWGIYERSASKDTSSGSNIANFSCGGCGRTWSVREVGLLASNQRYQDLWSEYFKLPHLCAGPTSVRGKLLIMRPGGRRSFPVAYFFPEEPHLCPGVGPGREYVILAKKPPQAEGLAEGREAGVIVELTLISTRYHRGGPTHTQSMTPELEEVLEKINSILTEIEQIEDGQI